MQKVIHLQESIMRHMLHVCEKSIHVWHKSIHLFQKHAIHKRVTRYVTAGPFLMASV